MSTPIPGGAVMLDVIMVEKFFKINFKDVHPTDMYLFVSKKGERELKKNGENSRKKEGWN